jgi:hypothetical protein
LDWQCVVIVEKYNKKLLFLMLLKCHHLSHHVVESKVLLNQMNGENFCFENFNMTIGTRGVSHHGLANYIKKYLKAKGELWKLNYFTMQKYHLQKIL